MRQNSIHRNSDLSGGNESESHGDWKIILSFFVFFIFFKILVFMFFKSNLFLTLTFTLHFLFLLLRGWEDLFSGGFPGVLQKRFVSDNALIFYKKVWLIASFSTCMVTFKPTPLRSWLIIMTAKPRSGDRLEECGLMEFLLMINLTLLCFFLFLRADLRQFIANFLACSFLLMWGVWHFCGSQVTCGCGWSLCGSAFGQTYILTGPLTCLTGNCNGKEEDEKIVSCIT